MFGILGTLAAGLAPTIIGAINGSSNSAPTPEFVQQLVSDTMSGSGSGQDLTGLINGLNGVKTASMISPFLSLGSDVVKAISAGNTNAYNERLLREAWARDDTAVQRRVRDLMSAGLSPTLAAGSASASSSPISVNSPLAGFSDQGRNLIDSINASKSIDLAKMSLLSSTFQNALREKQMDKISSEISKLNKDVKYLGWLRVSQIIRNYGSLNPLRFTHKF